jgi:hypothetical protein
VKSRPREFRSVKIGAIEAGVCEITLSDLASSKSSAFHVKVGKITVVQQTIFEGN